MTATDAPSRVAASSIARSERAASDSDVQIRCLGAFSVTAGGQPVTVPNGLPRQALKLAIVQGGHVHVEVVMDRLWPDSDLAGGRKGIRNVLSRLGGVGVPLLVRDDEVLRLAERVRVDAPEFRRLADRALTSPDPIEATRLARQAIGLYQGPFLGEDRYVEWTDVPRRRLRRRRVALLDVLAADARRRDAGTEAVHLMELALEDDPHDERRYLELAEVLVAQGRRGRASALIAEAEVVLRDLGLGPDPSWSQVRLELLRGRRVTPNPGTPTRALAVSPEMSRPAHHVTHHRQVGPNHRGGSS